MYTYSRGVTGIGGTMEYRLSRGARRSFTPIRLSALGTPKPQAVSNQKNSDSTAYFWTLPLIALIALLIIGPVRIKSSPYKPHSPTYTNIPVSLRESLAKSNLTTSSSSSTNRTNSNSSKPSSSPTKPTSAGLLSNSSTTLVGGRGGGPTGSDSTGATSPTLILSSTSPTTDPLADFSSGTSLNVAGQTVQTTTDPAVGGGGLGL